MGGGGGSVPGGRVEFIGRDDGTGLSPVLAVEAYFVFLGGGGGGATGGNGIGCAESTAATRTVNVYGQLYWRRLV